MENMRKAEFEYAENKEGKIKIYFTLNEEEYALDIDLFMLLNDLNISDIK